jgi:CHAT domain-containing protein
VKGASLRSLEAAIKQAARLRQRGEFAAALQLLAETVRERFVSTPDANDPASERTVIDMLAIEQLADLALLFSETDAAQDLLASAAIWYQRAGNCYFGDYIAVKRIHIALGGGQLEEARAMLFAMQASVGDVKAISFSEAGLAQWERAVQWPGAAALDRRLLLSQLYLEMGRILAGLGQYRDALSATARGLRNAGQAEPRAVRSVLAHLKLEQVSALLEFGELAEAQLQLNEARISLDEFEQPGLFIRSLELAGKLALLAGRLGDALERFKEVCRSCQKHGFDKPSVTASLNLAQVLIYLNQTSEARDLLESIGLRAQADRDVDNAERAALLMQMSYARGHSLADGVPIAPSISEIWQAAEGAAIEPPSSPERDPLSIRRSPDYLMFFEDRALAFHWYLGCLGLRAAGEVLSDIEETFAGTDSKLIATRLQVMKGMLAYYRNDFAVAERFLVDACRELRVLGLKPEQWQAQRFICWCLAAQNRPRTEQEALAIATQTLLEEITLSLGPADRVFYVLNKWTAEEEYIANEINRLIDLKKNLQRRPWPFQLHKRWQLMKEVHALLEHIDEYKRILAHRHILGEELKSRLRNESSPLARLWRHPRDRVTISFLVLPDRVFIARVGWLSLLDFGLSPMTRIRLRDLVRQWHQPLVDFVTGDGDDTTNSQTTGQQPLNQPGGADAGNNIDTLKAQLSHDALTAHLAEDLQLSPLIKSLPKRIRALTIIPDDSLHGFPFAAIKYEGRYLIERFALSVAFESRERSVVAATTSTREALAVGVSKASGGLEPLSATPFELQHVTGWMSAHGLNCHKLDDVTSTDRWPNKATIIELLPRATMVHIACHGIFRPDQPDASGILLVPAPGQSELLSLRDLSVLNLSAVQHATLSSCWSADHFVLPGRWVMSLPETFYRAGAQSVLACLWVVSDEVAVAFMKRFYYYVSDHARDDALRLAQLDCLRDQLPDCRIGDQKYPVFWAGFNLYGDPGPLQL